MMFMVMLKALIPYHNHNGNMIYACCLYNITLHILPDRELIESSDP